MSGGLKLRVSGLGFMSCCQHAQFSRSVKQVLSIQEKLLTEMCNGSEAGSYLRLLDFGIINPRIESHKEEEEEGEATEACPRVQGLGRKVEGWVVIRPRVQGLRGND